MRVALLILTVTLAIAPVADAQTASSCRLLCAPEFKVEPTLTFSEDDKETELILSLGLPTRMPWLEFTFEAIVMPFDSRATPELEFETNFIWLPSDRTDGWVSSHFDVVDKFSPAERSTDRRAYTHKLNLELDTSVAPFNRLPEGRWLRSVELEGSLDYVASGLPKDANPWSFSIVLVLPIAPF